MKLWVLVPVAGAIGFGAGWWLAPAPRGSDLAGQLERQVRAVDQLLASERRTTPGSTVWTPCSDTKVSEASLRKAIREELASAASARPADGQASVPAAEEVSPESAIAVEQARILVERAIADGRWTDDDALALRAQIPLLTEEQRQEILSTLIPAINRQEVAVEVTGPAF